MEEQRRLWTSNQWGSLAAALAIFAVLGVARHFDDPARPWNDRAKEPGPAAGKSKPSRGKLFMIVEAIPEATVEADVAAAPAQQDYLAMQVVPDDDALKPPKRYSW